jgi:hypothetical protein
VVYAENNFFTVTEADVAKHTRDLARLDALRAPRGPAFVELHLPEDPARREQMRDEMRRGGPPITWLGDYYQALDAAGWERIYARSVPIELMASRDARVAQDLKHFTERHLRPLAEFGFVPVTGRDGVVMMVFDRRNDAPIDWME